MKAIVLLLSLLGVSAADLAGQEGFILRVHVVDGVTSAPVRSADVHVEGVGSAATGLDGWARFPTVPPGTHHLRILAMGYRTVDVDVEVRANTTLAVSLEIEPLEIDSILVETESRRVMLRVSVKGSDTDRGVPHAEVVLGSVQDETDGVGWIHIPVAAGTSRRLEVRAVGYRTWSSDVTLLEDSTVTVKLDVDPVAQQLVKRQIQRLDRRSNGVPWVTRVVSREHLLSQGGGTALDLLRFNGVSGKPPCLVIDEREWPGGTERLLSYAPEEIERIEILFKGWMVRVYTFDYVRKTMPRRRTTFHSVMRGFCW